MPASPNRTLIGAIRGLFRAAVDAVTRRAPNPQPQPRRKRRGGETRQAFATAKALLRRAVSLPPEAYAAATAFLSDTLDWLALWDDDIECSSEPGHSDTEQNYLSPHL